MILEILKTQTAECHRRVEESRLLQSLTAPSLTSGTYCIILQKFYGYFQPLENRVDIISGIRELLPDYLHRRKASLLQQDLAAVPGGCPAGLPICEDLPEVNSLGQAMGCLYVMEGSTLGGRFIARQLQEHLGLTPATGAAFFHGYGSETGSRWKAFQQALVVYSQATRNEKAVVGAAEETFLKLEKWLNQ